MANRKVGPKKGTVNNPQGRNQYTAGGAAKAAVSMRKQSNEIMVRGGTHARRLSDAKKAYTVAIKSGDKTAWAKARKAEASVQPYKDEVIGVARTLQKLGGKVTQKALDEAIARAPARPAKKKKK